MSDSSWKSPSSGPPLRLGARTGARHSPAAQQQGAVCHLSCCSLLGVMCPAHLLLQASQRLCAGCGCVHAACSTLHLLLLRLAPGQQLEAVQGMWRPPTAVSRALGD
jgi:hypothetical protein